MDILNLNFCVISVSGLSNKLNVRQSRRSCFLFRVKNVLRLYSPPNLLLTWSSEQFGRVRAGYVRIREASTKIDYGSGASREWFLFVNGNDSKFENSKL